MNTSLKEMKTWVAHFDILGFKERIDYEAKSLHLELLLSSVKEVIEKLERKIDRLDGAIAYESYADTFIIYADTDEKDVYSNILRASKDFLTTCINKGLPVRGAISYGELIFALGGKMIIGRALLESNQYGEDQNWIGLILTPSASAQLESMDLDPIRHGFISRDIPFKRYPILDEDVYAYRFINGSTNFPCPLLPKLNEMLEKAPNKDKVKYINTIRFIEKHYTVH
jgi:hypothetical protein